MAFFVELGLELEARHRSRAAGWIRVVGLEGVRADIATMRTPDGHGRLELTKFHTPSGRDEDPHAQANALASVMSRSPVRASTMSSTACGLTAPNSSASWSSYENSYRLCYVRGPEGIIIELAEQIE